MAIASGKAHHHQCFTLLISSSPLAYTATSSQSCGGFKTIGFYLPTFICGPLAADLSAWKDRLLMLPCIWHVCLGLDGLRLMESVLSNIMSWIYRKSVAFHRWEIIDCGNVLGLCTLYHVLKSQRLSNPLVSQGVVCWCKTFIFVLVFLSVGWAQVYTLTMNHGKTTSIIQYENELLHKVEFFLHSTSVLKGTLHAECTLLSLEWSQNVLSSLIKNIPGLVFCFLHAGLGNPFCLIWSFHLYRRSTLICTTWNLFYNKWNREFPFTFSHKL